nr:bacillithiol biosynthesis BshC [Chitinophagaceae bacterium]
MKFSPHTLPYEQTGYFSTLVLDYIQKNQDLTDFIFDFPSPEALKEKMNNRLASSLHRKVLHDSLKAQYKDVAQQSAVQSSIDALLQENTFTICTAHQPNIFTGHLYFIYKIIHAIKLAETCKSLFPASNFVPI